MKFDTKSKNDKQTKLDLRSVNVTNPQDLVGLEKKVLELWNDLDLVNLLKTKNQNNTKFSFFDGPVTANNPLGVHHAWGRTLKDTVQRFKALQGYNQRFEYGFDTQGLWVEVEVEKALGFNSKNELESYGVDKFVNDCKARVAHFSSVQDEQSLNLGMLKSSDSYYTHSDENISAIWQFLKVTHERGWLYQGVRPMPWCPRCGTSLSSHEQADGYKEVTHTSVFAKFKLKSSKDYPDNTYFVVWTTTPWTLPANLAVAVHPNKEYAFYSNGEETLVAGLWLKDQLFENYKVVDTKLGKDLEQYSYTTAFSDLPSQYLDTYKVVTWNEVTEDEGTGVVHLAPGCGQEDYTLLKDEFDPLSPLSEDGTYLTGYGLFSNLHYSEVNVLVETELVRRELLFQTKDYTHRYPHCWRCKTELVYRLVDEWFLGMDEVRPQLVKAADEVVWNPDYTKKLFLDWVNNMGDWCVSRKRYWGLPLPFYKCECGHLTVVGSKDEFLANAAGPVEQVEELHLPWVDKVKYPCESCGNLVERVSEVGDCWLDAGVMPFSTLGYFNGDRSNWEEWFPADFVCEMREQVRLWFYSLMVLSVTLTGKPPFRNLLSYEMVRDKNNQEMHKSGKNNVLLDDALQKLSSDTLRLYYLSQSRTSNMRFDFDVGLQHFKLLRKLTHSFNFFQTYADLENFKFDPVNKSNNLYDRWMLSRLNYFSDTYQQLMEKYDQQGVVVLLEEMLEDLSSWYLRRVRERVWNKMNTGNLLVYHTLFKVFRQISVLFAPLTPFLSEVVYQNLRRYSNSLQVSVHLEDFRVLNDRDVDLENSMSKLRKFDELNRQLRNEVVVKLRQPLKVAYLWGSTLNDFPEELFSDLKELLNVKKVKFVNKPSKYVNFKLLPDYSKLGPKFGNKVQDVAEKLGDLSSEEVVDFYFGNDADLHLDNYRLTLDDVELRLEGKNKLQLKTDQNLLLLLDLTLDEELRMEGWLNDFSRQVQVARKERGFNVEQRVELQLFGNSKLTNQVIKKSKHLVDQLYLSNVKITDGPLPEVFEHELGELSYLLVN